MSILYFLIAIFSTTVGALTGMGGGVIIKPTLDLLGSVDAASINVMSSIAVFCMSVVSLGRQIGNGVAFNVRLTLLLACSSLTGGHLGQRLLTRLIERMPNNTIIFTQNAALAILLGGVMLYMFRKERPKPRELCGFLPTVLTGFILGMLSSFLGIGGGPINVAAILYLFSLDIKAAAVCSLVTIFFAQAAKLVSVLANGGFVGYELSMLGPLVVGAVMGGFLGACLQRKISERSVVTTFNVVQLAVFGVCVFNMVKCL
jgi:uncharacterized membrane protein YfcA